MRKFLFQTVLALALISFFSACETESSSDVDQNRIHAAYELFYDKKSNETTAVAVFRFGSSVGTQLELASPSEVRFNNDVLAFNAILGRYEKSYKDQWIKSGTFTFTDTEGKTYTTSSDVMKAADFAATPEVLTFSKNADQTVSWVGDPLGQDETVGALLIGPGNIFNIKQSGATGFPVNKANLTNVNPGDYLISMDRWLAAPLTEKTDAGGEIVVKYRSAAKNVKVTL